MRRVWLAAIFLTALTAASPAPENVNRIPAKTLFSRVAVPSQAEAQSIGGYAVGCLAGAQALPLTDPDNAKTPAWQVMRPSRNRNWGNPVMIGFLEDFARQARKAGDWPGLLVGDIAQPRGGPMSSGHASHQIGLDADIWLTPAPARALSRKERETREAVSVVKDHYSINPKVWTDAHARLIARAAKSPQVARIFVHPPIKKALCDWSRGDADRRWLAKVRPYYGHDAHFHIRLNCPKGNSACKAQKPPSPADGTGCGLELKTWLSPAFWARHQPPAPGKPVKPGKQMMLSALPAACRAVLNSP